MLPRHRGPRLLPLRQPQSGRQMPPRPRMWAARSGALGISQPGGALQDHESFPLRPSDIHFHACCRCFFETGRLAMTTDTSLRLDLPSSPRGAKRYLSVARSPWERVSAKCNTARGPAALRARDEPRRCPEARRQGPRPAAPRASPAGDQSGQSHFLGVIKIFQFHTENEPWLKADEHPVVPVSAN